VSSDRRAWNSVARSDDGGDDDDDDDGGASVSNSVTSRSSGAPPSASVSSSRPNKGRWATSSRTLVFPDSSRTAPDSRSAVSGASGPSEWPCLSCTSTSSAASATNSSSTANAHNQQHGTRAVPRPFRVPRRQFVSGAITSSQFTLTIF